MDSRKTETPFRAFPYRVIAGNDVLLRLADCADVLHTPLTELQPYCKSVKKLDGFGPCITEAEFNRIRREHYAAEPVLEQTSFFTTLENDAKTALRMLPLKLAFAERMFQKKAAEQGMTLEEYLYTVDFPRELEERREKIKKQQTVRKQITAYERNLANALKNAKNIPTEKFAFTLQHLGCLKNGEVYFRTYFAGQDIFFETDWEELRCVEWEKAELIAGNCFRLPDAVDVKLPAAGKRDFRDWSVLDNILYCLENICGDQEIADEIFLKGEGVRISVEIDLLAKLFNPGSCPNTHFFELIPGKPDEVRIIF